MSLKSNSTIYLDSSSQNSVGFSGRLFSSKSETLNLLIPILLIPVAIINLLDFDLWGLNNPMRFQISNTFSSILFLNTTHTLFSLLMLFYIPELGSLVTERESGRSYRFWLKLSAICLGVGLFFSWANPKIDHLIFPDPANWAILLFYLLFGYLPTHHAVSQISGLSLMYNHFSRQGGGLTHDQVTLLNSHEKRERLWFTILNAGASLMAVFQLLKKGPFVSADNYAIIRSILVFTMSLSVINILYIGFKLKSFTGNKFPYLLRILIVPTIAWLPISYLSIGIIHGFEYYFVFRKFHQQTHHRLAVKSKALIAVTVGLFTVVTAIALLKWDPVNFFPFVPHEVALLCNAIFFAVTFSHYWLDRYIFQMRHIPNRKWVGQLFSIESDRAV